MSITDDELNVMMRFVEETLIPRALKPHAEAINAQGDVLAAHGKMLTALAAVVADEKAKAETRAKDGEVVGRKRVHRDEHGRVDYVEELAPPKSKTRGSKTRGRPVHSVPPPSPEQTAAAIAQARTGLQLRQHTR